jgi:hypothetical protein
MTVSKIVKTPFGADRAEMRRVVNTRWSLSEKSVLGSTGYQPVPSGDSPDGMGETL